MKQLKKQLAAAIIMTLVAAISLGSSTYAWFANNTQASANDMSVTVKSDVGFMLIAAGHKTVEEIQAGEKTSVSAATKSGALYPTAHTTSIATTSQLKDYIQFFDSPSKWYYAYSESASKSDKDEETVTALSATNMDEYVLVNEFSLCAASGSNSMTNLKVKSITLGTTGDEAVKALVVSDSNYEEFETEGTGEKKGIKSLGGVSPDSVTTIKVYVYWDGENSKVFTNNKGKLKNTDVNITFEATPIT